MAHEMAGAVTGRFSSRANIEAQCLEAKMNPAAQMPGYVGIIAYEDDYALRQGNIRNHLNGCGIGSPPRQTMHHTGDRCCVARETQIIFEGTEAECHAFAEEHLKKNTIGGSKMSIYAPLAVVSMTQEYVTKVETRQVMKVRR